MGCLWGKKTYQDAFINIRIFLMGIFQHTWKETLLIVSFIFTESNSRKKADTSSLSDLTHLTQKTKTDAVQFDYKSQYKSE